MRNLFTLSLALTLCLFSASGFAVQIVDSTGGGDHTTIAAAVAAASNGEEIRLAAGGPYVEEILLGNAVGWNNKDNLTFTNPGACVWAPPNTGAFGAGLGSGLIIGAGITQVTLQDINLDGSVNAAAIGIFAAAPITLNLDGTSITGFGGGVGGGDGYASSGGALFNSSPLTINMTNGASINNNSGHGLGLDLNAAPSSGYLVLNMSGGSSIDGNASNGVLLSSSDGPNAFTLTGSSSISSNGNRAIEVANNASGGNTFSFTDSTVAGNTGNALQLAGGSLQTITVTNSNCVGNQRFAAMNSGAVTAVLSDTDFSSTGNPNPQQPINVGNVTGAVDITATNCDFNQGSIGFWVHPPTDVGVEIRLTGCSITSNTAQGILTQTFPTSWTLTNCTIDGNTSWAMNHEGGGSLTATGTSFSNSGVGAGGYAAGSAAATIDATNCFFNDNASNGIFLWNAAVAYDVTLDGCEVDGNGAIGFTIDATNSTDCSLTNTSISGNTGAGLNITGGSLDCVLNGCTLESNTDHGINVGATTASTLTLNATSVSSNATAGVIYVGPNGSAALVATNASSVDGNGWCGIRAGLDGNEFTNSSLSVSLTDSTVSGNTNQGIVTDGGNSDFDITLNNTSMVANTESAIHFDVGTAAEADIDVTLENGSLIDRGGAAKVGIECATDAPTLDVTVNDSAINNGRRAIFPTTAFTGICTITGTNPTFNGEQNNVIHTDNLSTFDMVVNLTNVTADFTAGGILNRLIAHNANNLDLDIAGGTITAFGKQLINITGNAPTTIDVDIDSLSATGSGLGGVNEVGVRFEPAGGTCSLDLTNSTIIGANGHGVLIGGAPANNVPVTLDGTSVTNSTGQGIQITVPATVSANNLTAEGNGEHGVYVTNAVNVTADGLSASNNVKNGVLSSPAATSWNLSNSDLDGNGWWGINHEGGGSLTAVNTSFDGNSSPAGLFGGYAGGINNVTIDATGCSFSNNGGNNTTQNHGILLWNSGAVYDVTLVDCQVDGNVMAAVRADLQAVGSSLSATTTTFNSNTQTAISYVGGTLSLDDCAFVNSGSGVIQDAGPAGSVEMVDCDFDTIAAQAYWNQADASVTTLTGCTFDAVLNTPVQVSGANARLTMDGCTLTGNTYGIFLPGANLMTDIANTDVIGTNQPGLQALGTGQTHTLTGCDFVSNSEGISANQADTTLTLTGCTLTGNTARGVLLTGTAGRQVLTVDSTRISGNGLSGIQVEAAGDPQLELTVLNNSEVSTNSGSGVFLYLPDTTVPAQINVSDSHFDGNTGDSGFNIPDVAAGVALTASNMTCDRNVFGFTGGWQAQATTLTAVLTDCSFSDNANNNFNWNNAGGLQAVDITATGCHFDNSGAAYGLIPNDGGVVSLTNCSLDGNALNGFHAPDVEMTAINTTFDGNADHGLFLWGGANPAAITMSGSSLSNNGHGMRVACVGVVPIDFTNVNVDGNTTYGLELWDIAQYQLTWDGGSCDDTVAGNGINIVGNGNPGAVLDLANLSVSNNAGIAMTLTGEGVDAVLDNVAVEDNGLFGVWVQSGFASLFDIETTGSTSLSSNANSGLHLFLPSGEAALTLTDSFFDDNGQRGVVNELSTQFSCVASGSSFSGNTGDGFEVGSSGATPGSVLMTGCTLDNNTGSGFTGGVRTTEIDVELVECSLSGNGLDNFHFIPDAVSTSTRSVALTSCTLNNAGASAVALGDVAAGDLTTTITGCDFAGNASGVLWAPYSGDHQLTVDNCQIDATQGLGSMFTIPARASTLTLTVKDSDFLTTGRALLNHTTGTLVATFEHVTFVKPDQVANPNLLLLDSGSSDTAISIDQCDFYNAGGTGLQGMTAVWIRGTDGNGGLPSWPGTLDVRDSILTDCGMFSGVDATRITQDYNLAFGDSGFTLSPDPDTGAGWTGGTNNVTGNPLYRSTTFGDVNHLVLGPGSPAIGLNSGNGSEDYAGAKGYAGYVEPVSPTAARNWFLY